MGQYVPTADLNLRAQKKKNPRIPRKKGQPAGSKKHSDLYTDENPRGTIHGLKFATVQDARDSVKKIENSGKKHAHTNTMQSQWNNVQKRWVRLLKPQSIVHILRR